MIKVGIVGHDPYTIPLMDGLGRQPDFQVIGAYNHDPTPFSKPISKKIPVYCSKSNLSFFKERGIKVSGFLEEFIESADAFLEYDSVEMSIKISYGSSGIVIRPYEVLLERLSASIPIKDISLEEISDDLFCCPFFRAFKVKLKLAEKIDLNWIKDSLLSSPRVLVISGGVYLQDLCLFLLVAAPYSQFSVSVILRSIRVVSEDSSSIELISLLGYMICLPEAIDTLRESNGVKRDFSRGITDKHLSIKGGLIL